MSGLGDGQGNRMKLYEMLGYEEGKKIGWKDGFRALWCIVKYNTFRGTSHPAASPAASPAPAAAGSAAT